MLPRRLAAPLAGLLLLIAASVGLPRAARTAPEPAAPKPRLIVQAGHPALVRDVAVSPDGHTAATAGDDGTVKLWDPRTAELRDTLLAHPGVAYAVAFSADGKTLATGGDDGRVKLWDVSTGALQREWLAKGWIYCLAFSPDGKLLASGSHQDEGRVKVWDAATGTLRHTLEGHREYMVHAVAFSPDGKLLASGGADQTVRLWDPAAGKPLKTLDAGGRVTALAFSPDGSLLASGGERFTRVWRVETGTSERRIEAGGAGAHSLRFSADGATLFIVGDRGLSGWDPRTGRQVEAGVAWFDAFAAAVGPGGRRAVTSHYSRDLRFWDLDRPEALQVPGPVQWIMALRYSPNGKHLVTAGDDRYVRVWDLRAGRLERLLECPLSYAVAFSPDGKLLAAGSAHPDPSAPRGVFSELYLSEVRIWEFPSGRLLHTLAEQRGVVKDLAFSQDGKTLVTASVEPDRPAVELRLWEVRTGKLTRSVPVPGKRVFHLALDPGLQRFAVDREGALELWDLPTGRMTRSIPVSSGSALRLRFSPDGQRLAVGRYEHELMLWDPATGTRVREFQEPARQVDAVEFSPDGQLLASGGYDRRLTLRSVATGQVVSTLTLPQHAVRALGFAPDGKSLAVGGAGNTVALWNLPEASLRATLTVLPPARRGAPGTEWLVRTADDHYDGSPGAVAFLRWRLGPDLLPASRFESQYRRPEPRPVLSESR